MEMGFAALVKTSASQLLQAKATNASGMIGLAWSDRQV
jgi:hypothetical protein